MDEKTLAQLAEVRIREARAAGAAPTGNGRPLPPDPHAGLRDEDRFSARVASLSGYVPQELQLEAELRALRAELDAADDDEVRATLRRTIRDKAIQLSLLHETSGRPLAANRAIPFVPG